ncbi:adenine deaminase C-terminal domain-containing protein [Sutcliffiella rhizosphaerae]|uniref:adenine deaminase n=1 Tax=Sutcliffiella rhizosphaerae TaxID=2880967 RepID=A0ABN8A8B2_9BACI|nr:adenine deaminase C-terminal domain-containing protein [Sutcliffiella rhizosphaerae]CAG9621350.1 Putative adenine deaminase YerA [Sutcliffiella rhizosphaerae]
MHEQSYRWKSKKIREQIAVIDGSVTPTIVLTNATYLNVQMKIWLKANIWIYEDRIIYVGDQFPSDTKGTEIVDCQSYYLVPGYIEPHVHPFQLYNPLSFAQYASKTGTTTFVNDNLMLTLQMTKKKAFSFIEKMNETVATMYWWCRFDGQTEIRNDEEVFSTRNLKSWLNHPLVMQGGELTSWPKLLDGDDFILHWVQEANARKKPVEGHFPGASEKTLTKMQLLGISSDHEAMNGADVIKRISQGYHASLRYSSIRPDLPLILEELEASGVYYYDQTFFNTDGSTPSFYENGVIDRAIAIALDKGVPLVEAYRMATLNVATHFYMEKYHGSIAPGRIANINFLEAKEKPTPVSVLSKGRWVTKDGAVQEEAFSEQDWSALGLGSLKLEWELSIDDLQFSMALGMEMVNEVIIKPYTVTVDVAMDRLSTDHDESFLMLVDRAGRWRVNTILKGFGTHVEGFASSYSNTGDIVLIGKDKQSMLQAFQRMKEIGGGMVLVENGGVVSEIPLPLAGGMSNCKMEELMNQESELRQHLFDRGYPFGDPVYTLLFLSSTHLPYIRITPRGIYDVMNKTVLFPSIMR